MPGRGEGSSRAMLATARHSCFSLVSACHFRGAPNFLLAVGLRPGPEEKLPDGFKRNGCRKRIGATAVKANDESDKRGADERKGDRHLPQGVVPSNVQPWLRLWDHDRFIDLQPQRWYIDEASNKKEAGIVHFQFQMLRSSKIAGPRSRDYKSAYDAVSTSVYRAPNCNTLWLYSK